jgi:hypothetical protein
MGAASEEGMSEKGPSGTGEGIHHHMGELGGGGGGGGGWYFLKKR